MPFDIIVVIIIIITSTVMIIFLSLVLSVIIVVVVITIIIVIDFLKARLFASQPLPRKAAVVDVSVFNCDQCNTGLTLLTEVARQVLSYIMLHYATYAIMLHVSGCNRNLQRLMVLISFAFTANIISAYFLPLSVDVIVLMTFTKGSSQCIQVTACFH